nr:DNA polymerase III subunit gamma and tau [Haloechinothrix aidingensis]
MYRKYRPATFAEVVGQDHVTVPLRTALAAGRINHAYLFSGPRGCGKTSSARIMARSLNCAQGPTDEPCGECDSCRNLAPEGPGSIDVIELDAASHGGVDDARELRDRAFYAPAESRYRVFVIDEAHMVTAQGFNALLKIVEEPPEHLIFIFATTEPDKVLTTIRSRTHHYPFRLIPPGAMRELLERNAAAEGVTVEPAVFPLVIRAGAGSARDTQSVLDQLLAGAGPEGVTYDRAVALLGFTDSALLDDMIHALSAEDAASVYGTIERLTEAGHDPRRFATDLLTRLRDLVLLRSVPDAGEQGLVAAPEEELNRMSAQADRIGLGTLTRYAEIVHDGLREMRGATAPRLLLELLCARMMLPAATDDEAAVLHRVERLERRVTAGGAAPAADSPGRAADRAGEESQAPSRQHQDSAQPRQEQPVRRGEQADEQRPQPERPSEQDAAPAARQAPQPEQTQPEETHPEETHPEEVQREEVQPEPRPQVSREPEPQPQQPPEPSPGQAQPGSIDATALRGIWSQLLAEVRKSSRSTEAMLTNATVHSVDGSSVVLSHTAAPLARRLSEERNTDAVAAALHQVLGGQWQVTCVHAGSEAGAAPQAGRQRSQQQTQQRSQQQTQQQTGQPSEQARQHGPAADRQAATESPEARDAVRPEPERAEPERPEPERTEPERPGPAAYAAGTDDDIPLPPEEPDAEPDPEPPQVGSGQQGVSVHQLLSDELGARPLE